MARPRKSDGSAETSARVAEDAGFEPPFVPGASKPEMKRPKAKPRTSDGKFSIDWFAEMMSALNDYSVDYWNWWGRQWPEYREHVDTLLAQAKACGVDLSTYSPETISVTQIASIDEVFALTDSAIDQMTRQIGGAAVRAIDLLPDAKKKSWLSVLRKLRTLQSMCRDRAPSSWTQGMSQEETEAWEHIHPIRFMAYCQRSTMNARPGREEPILIPDHLILACLTRSLAKAAREAGYGIRGAITVIPPRHGKSWLMCATRALTMCLDPWSPFAVVHNKDDIASERVSMVKEWFDDDKAIGRRRAALFPRVRLNTRRSRAEGIIFLLHDGKPSNSHAEGNYIGFGIKAAAQGITLREIDFDDPVDERERHEEGSRVRTNHAFHSTWLNRLTGKDSFFTLISTCWHPSDVTGGMLSMARNGTVSAAVCTISCGGPDEDFRPIWPEAGYDARFLRSQYLRLGPVSYACIYQNRPDSSEGRRIGNLSFYDARMVTEPAARTEAWRRFLESPHTKHVLSVDPSGSDKITSNRAGILLSAFGDMECVLPDGTTQRLPRCIALRFWSIRATQHGLVDHVMSLIEAKERIDLILVETTAGYHATPEEMIRRGIPAAKVVRCTPGGTGSKIERLMRYGVHIENGDMAFPGEYTNDEHGDAVLQILPSWERVAEQLLSPDMASDNEMIDVVRQMLGYFAPEFRAAAMHDPETAKPVSRDQRALLEYYRNMVRPDRRKDEGRGTIAGFMQEKVGSWTG